jgi:hypothetical protein
MAGDYNRHWSFTVDENVSTALQQIAVASGEAETAVAGLGPTLGASLESISGTARAAEEEIQRLLAREKELTDAAPKFWQDQAANFHDTSSGQFVSPAAVAAEKAAREQEIAGLRQDLAQMQQVQATLAAEAATARNPAVGNSITGGPVAQTQEFGNLDQMIGRVRADIDALSREMGNLDRAFPTDTISGRINAINATLREMTTGNKQAFGSLIADLKESDINSHQLESAVHTLEQRYDVARQRVADLTKALEANLQVQATIEDRIINRSSKSYSTPQESAQANRSNTADEARLDRLEVSAERLNEQLVRSTALFDEIGVTLQREDGTWKTTEEVFAQTVLALRNMDPEVRRFNLNWMSMGAAGRGVVTEMGSLYTSLERVDAAERKAAESVGVLDAKLKDTSGHTKQQTGLENLDKELRTKPGDTNKATEAFGSMFTKMTAGVTSAMLLVTGLEQVGSSIEHLGEKFIDSGQAQEQYMAVFTRLTGSLQTAQANINATRQASLDLPVPVEKLLDVQRRYQAAVEQGTTVQDRYARSMDQLLSITADVAAARPDINITQLSTAIERVAVGAPNADRYIRQLGLSAEDLAKAGAQLTIQGKALSGDLQTNTDAVLTALENKYSGVAQIASTTWQGMSTEIGNFVTNAAVVLGQDIFVDMRTRLGELLDNLRKPETQATLQDWGDKLGKIWNVGMNAFDALATGIQKVADVLRPATDLLGAFIDALPQVEGAGVSAYDNLNAAASQYGATVGENLDITEQQASVLDGLKQQIAAIGDAQSDVRAQYDALKSPLQDHLANLRQGADSLKMQYDGMIQPWKDLIDLQDRVYEREKQERQVGSLQTKIAKDKALAVDIYSSAGRSAEDRLPGEEDQLTQLRADIAHKASDQALKDTITRLEKERDAKLNGIKLDEQNTQAQITQYDRLQKAALANMDAIKRNLETRVREMSAENRNWQNHLADTGKSYTAMDAQGSQALLHLGVTTATMGGQVQIRHKSMADAFELATSRMRGDVALLVESLLGPKGLVDADHAAQVSWDEFVAGLGPAGEEMNKLGTSVGTLAHQLGLDKGLAATMLVAKTTVAIFMDEITQGFPLLLSAVGGFFKTMGDGFDVLIKSVGVFALGWDALTHGGQVDQKELAKRTQALHDSAATLTQDNSANGNNLLKMFDAARKNLHDDILSQTKQEAKDLEAIFGGSAASTKTTQPQGPGLLGPVQGPVRTNPMTPGVPQTVPQSLGNPVPIQVTVQTQNTCPNCHQVQFQQDVRDNKQFISQTVAGAIFNRG